MTNSGRNTPSIRSFYDALHQDLQKYFKDHWLEMTGRSEKTFYNRLDNPKTFDIVMYQHLTGISLAKKMLNDYPEIKKLTPYQGQSVLDL